MCLPPSLLVERTLKGDSSKGRATIATQTDDPVIPILPLAKPFYYNVEVIREEWGTWRCHSGIQTDDLREPIMPRVNKRKNPITNDNYIPSLLKQYLEEFNQEEFPRSNPKRVYIPSSRAKSLETPTASRLVLDPIPVARDDGPVSEPFIDPSLGKVTKSKVRSLRMIAVIDHYEMKGLIKGMHITILRERFSKDFVSEEKYSLSGIRELLRSKGFGVDKYDRVKNFKK